MDLARVRRAYPDRLLDSGTEAAGRTYGGTLAHVPGGVHDQDGAQHGAPRSAGHALDQRVLAGAEAAKGSCALGRGRFDLAFPVFGAVGADDLARAVAHGVAIVFERGDVDGRAQRRHLRHGHADAEVRTRDLETGRPAFVDDLVASVHDDIGHDVLGPGD